MSFIEKESVFDALWSYVLNNIEYTVGETLEDITQKWDTRMLEVAKLHASWSKDPSTKTGTVIVRPDKTECSHGYNGFPRGISDKIELYENRVEKYRRIIHAEVNALLTAKEPLSGYTLYVWPLMPCERCAINIIQSGIIKVVAPVILKKYEDRWGESFELSASLFNEAGVDLVLYDFN